MVESDALNTFKNRLDKNWSSQEVLFDFNADLNGTGGQLVCIFSYRDAGIEDYLRPSELIGLDWKCPGSPDPPE